MRDGRVVVRVTAPPVERAANEAVVKALADALDIPRRAVGIVHGHKGRNKTVEIAGVDASELRRRMAALGGPAR